MSVSDIISIAGTVIALVALIVSFFAVRKANKFGATTDRLHKMQIEREEAENVASKKADLSANMIKVGKSDYRLKVFNRGKGTARNVRLTDLTGANSIIIPGSIEDKFPIPIFEQHQQVELSTAVTKDSSLGCHIKLQWDDKMGADYEKELTPRT